MTDFRIEGRGRRKDKENAAAFRNGWEEMDPKGSHGPEQSLPEVEKKGVEGGIMESLKF